MALIEIGSTGRNSARVQDAQALATFVYNKVGDSQIVVNQDNKDTTLGGTIDSTKEYFIDGVIDMGSTSIEIPSGGLNLRGYNFDLSKLTSSETGYTMFTSPVGGSGNVLGMDYSIEVTGSGSEVYDITGDTGFEAFEFARINYNDCTSLGTITAYRQGLETGTGRFGGTPELTLAGTWVGGYFIDTSIVRSLTAGSYSLFKAGASFTMASRFRSNQNIDLPANVSFVDFSSANFTNASTLQLVGCLVSRAGVFDASDTNLVPNIAPSDIASDWNNNRGIGNTFVGGNLTISSEATTTISSSGVFVDLAGTYTTSDLQHFDSPSSGQLRHLGDSPQEYRISGQVVLESAANDDIDLKVVIFRDATTSFEDGRTIRRVIDRLQGARNVGYFVVIDNITLAKNDYVKLQVANVSATNDVTAELDSFVIVESR